MAQINKTQFIDNFQYFDKEIVLEIIDIFINEYDGRIKAISESIEAVDYDGIKFNCHSVKGVIANFIAPDVEAKARDLEMMGANKDITGIEETFESFKVYSAEMVEELKALRTEFM